MKREKQKKVFNDHLDFFGLVMSYWVNDERNKEEINNFKKGYIVCLKISHSKMELALIYGEKKLMRK